MGPLRSLMLVLLSCLLATAAHTHSQSSSRLSLEVDDGEPQTLVVDLALVDLMQIVPLDRNADARVTWGEVLRSGEDISAFARDGVAVSAGPGMCEMFATERDIALTRYADVPFVSLRLRIRCPVLEQAGAYKLRYRLLFDINPAHAALLRVIDSSDEVAYLISDSNREIALTGSGSQRSGVAGFVGEGFRHILSGYDHLAFLLLLILPVAAGGSLRRRVVRIAAIVTAFTVAHSITLGAAVTGLVQLPAQPVEMAIAGSVVFAGVMNVVRPGHALGFRMAFCFGLLHGFGFAGALAELGLQRDTLLVNLLAFNAGVELGQLLVVALVLPLLALSSMSVRYRSVLVPAASLSGALAGAVWVATRL